MFEKIKAYLLERINLSAVSPSSFKTLFGFEVNRLMLFSLVFVFFVFSAIISFLIISYTPLSGLVPSNTEAYQKQELIEQQLIIDSLFLKVEQQEQYAADLRTVLLGKESHLNNIPDSIPKMEKADNLIDLEVGEAEQELMEKLQESLNTSTLVERKRTDSQSLFFFTPVQGSAALNPNDNNPSVLITSSRNASVKSVLDGKVIFVGLSKTSGFTMIIFHNANFISAYKNLNQVTKNAGDMVKVGEVIGVLDSPVDKKEKPKLQFELIQDGRFVDPFQFISFR